MIEKVKCKKCGLLIDSDLPYCPYCGYADDPTKEKEPKEESHISDYIKEEKTEKLKPKKDGLFNFPSHVLQVSFMYNIIYALVGFFGLQFLSLFYSIFSMAGGGFYFQISGAQDAAINFACYLTIFGILALISLRHLKDIFKQFANKEAILWGILGGFAVLLITSAVTALFNLIPHAGNNANEEAIDSISLTYPVLSIFVFGMLGPIVEELTYRVGLFSLIYKKSRVLAYILTAIIFGLIHFSFVGSDIVNELINLPTYITAGVLFCYIYEFKGLGASSIAHIINNVVAILFSILIARFS